MVKWSVVIAVAACGTSGRTEAPPVEEKGSAVVPTPDAAELGKAALREMPAKGVANSAIESVPRKDWPCRFVQTLDSVEPGGTHIATRWEYGTRKHCWIPVDVAGSRGLFGCPDKQVQQNLENKVEIAESYVYDAQDHLIAVQTMAARFEYAWDGNLVRGFKLRGEERPYEATEDGIEIKFADNDIVRVALDKQGHVATYRRIGDLDFSTLFTWKGSRLVKMQEVGTTKIDYVCKAPPK